MKFKSKGCKHLYIILDVLFVMVLKMAYSNLLCVAWIYILHERIILIV